MFEEQNKRGEERSKPVKDVEKRQLNVWKQSRAREKERKGKEMFAYNLEKLSKNQTSAGEAGRRKK